MSLLPFPDQDPITKCYDTVFLIKYENPLPNLFAVDEGDATSKSLVTNPPKIRNNASEFSVYTLARNAVLRSWCLSFNNERVYFIPPLAPMKAMGYEPEIFPKSATLGLKTLYTLIKQSRNNCPDMCISTLKILFETLETFNPEDLKDDPIEIVDEIFETLLELSGISSGGFSSHEEQITALSCSCLLALAISSGNNSKILIATSHMLRSPDVLEKQRIVVPRILNMFYESVKHIAIGSNQMLTFMQDGVQEENVVTEIKLPFPANSKLFKSTFTLYSFVSDGTFLFVCSNWGIFKIGTGFCGSIKSLVYIHNQSLCSNMNIMSHKDNIYLMGKNTDTIYILNKETLEFRTLNITLPQEFYSPRAIRYSDVEHIGLIYPNNQDKLVLNLYCLNVSADKTKVTLILVKRIHLNLAKQYTYILGWPAYEDDSIHIMAGPIKINHDHTIVSVAAGKTFTICRTALGQVYFQGDPVLLGLKIPNSLMCTSWTQLHTGKSASIVDMAVGHNALHAVLITEGGTALYYGTPQRGEDGDFNRYRSKAAPVKGKPFVKVINEIVVSASCNYLSTALVTKDGKLFIFGKDSQYANELGLVPLDHKIVLVSLGKAHGVAITRQGGVITFGINNKGQCGRFNIQSNAKFCAFSKHKWGNELCMICTKCNKCTGFRNCTNSSPEDIGTGRICGCGEGPSGCMKCGICSHCVKKETRRSYNEPSTSTKKPTMKQSLKKTIVMTQSTKEPCDEYTSSENENPPKKANLPPAVINIDAFIVSVSCGLHHTVLLSDIGQVFTFGLNTSGQLGTSDKGAVDQIVKLSIPKATQVAAGSNHTVILLENGDILTMGSNNKGQLGREVDGDEPIALPISHFGTAKGCKATWIGASGDETFIKLDESIVNLHLLQNSIIIGNKQNLLLIPHEKQSLYKQLTINKKDGECFSFDKKGVLEFEESAASFDPGHDIIWNFNSQELKFTAFGHYNPIETKNSARLNISVPTWDFTCGRENDEDVVEGNTAKNTVNVLTSQLALTSVCHATISRQQLAINLLSYLDTINYNEKRVLQFEDFNASHKIDTKQVEFSLANRFNATSSGWNPKVSKDSIDAIRFSADHNLYIGGVNLFGVRGNYKVTLSIYDIGFEGGDKEHDGELLAETDELVIDPKTSNKFAVLFDTPVIIQANCWYVISARVDGPRCEYGTGGFEEVDINEVMFQFKSSQKSTSGTDVNKGQIPSLIFKTHHRFDNMSYDIDIEEIYKFRCLYSKDITPAGLDALHKSLSWALNNLMICYKRFKHNITAKDVVKYTYLMERYATTCCYVLRLVKVYVLGLYSIFAPKGNEKQEAVDVVYEIRQLLNTILTYNDKIILPLRTAIRKNVVEYANKVLFMTLNVLQHLYEDLFHVFYPLHEMKWKHLCSALKGVQESRCQKNVFMLNVICTSLTKSSSFGKVLQNIVLKKLEYYNDLVHYRLLTNKMTPRHKSQNEKEMWSFHDVINVLLSLINGQTVFNVNHHLHLAQSSIADCNPDNVYLHLIGNCCSLVIRCLSELTHFCTEKEFPIGLDPREYISTPSRYSCTNTSSNWIPKRGFPDAIAFKVDRPGIVILGVTVYPGAGQYAYEMELLDQPGELNDTSLQAWRSVEFKKGTFTVYDPDPEELRFARAIPIKELSKYAIRLWLNGRPTKSGCQGVPIVQGPDGTTFTFSNCNLCMNGTNVSIGQIPSIIYMSFSKGKDNASRTLPFNNELNIPAKQVATICRQIIKESCDILKAARGVFEENPQMCHEIFQKSITFSRLLPFAMALLSQVRDPESALETFGLVQDILPLIVNLNMMFQDDFKSLADTAASYTATVESEHPYKPANVFVQCVRFPANIGFIVIEMDPRCGTCQPEDILYLYIPVNPNSKNNIGNNLMLRHDGFEEPTSYTRIGPSFKNTEWPTRGILIPGNEVLFYMETATDYIRDENSNKFGFKCQVLAYEGTLEKFSILQKLETDIVHLGGICAAALINPKMSPHGDAEKQKPPTDEVLSVFDYHQAQSLLANGLALESIPTVREALDGSLVLRHNSSRQCFLRNFIKCTTGTPGGRLANWLQPDPFVDPTNCFLVAPSSDIYASESCEIVLNLRDQHNRPVSCPDIYVQVTAHHLNLRDVPKPSISTAKNPTPSTSTAKNPTPSTSTAKNPTPSTSTQEQSAQDVPYLATLKDNMQFNCITMMKDYQDYCFEELRLGPATLRSTEHLTVRCITDDKVFTSWIPQAPGPYMLDCSIDGYDVLKNLLLQVLEPLEKKEPPALAPLDSEKPKLNSRKVYLDEDSAGLRIRASPSLQSEQLGVIPGGSSVSFDDVTLNGDGVWLRLNKKCMGKYLGTVPQDSEAWCMQYNQHLGKSFLLATDIDDDPLKDEVIGELGADLNPKYKVIKLTEVRTMPIKSAPVIGILFAGEMITIKQISANTGEVWLELNPSVVANRGFISPSGESWISRTSVHSSVEYMSLSDDEGTESVQIKRAKKKGVKVRDTTMADICGPQNKKENIRKQSFDRRQAHSSVPCEASDNSGCSTKSVSFGGAIRKVRVGDSSVKEEKDELGQGKKGHKRKTKDYHACDSPQKVEPSKFPHSPQQFASPPPVDPTAQRPPSPSLECDELTEEYCLSADTVETYVDLAPSSSPLPEENILLQAISPSRAESLRACFAAILWHEGIVDDALTCASYLKFQPNLPKEGAEVVTRPSMELSQPCASQRHSVEVMNAGNILNIQQSTLDTLNKSALSANRKRKGKFDPNIYKEVSMISEEDNSQCSDEQVSKGRDVVCVLPAALRGLVALWEQVNELQIQSEDLNKPVFVNVSPLKKTSDKVSSQQSSDSDDNIQTQEVTGSIMKYSVISCELCSEKIYSYWLVNHCVDYHLGCGKESVGGYGYNGVFSNEWRGECGAIHRNALSGGYVLCELCREKAKRAVDDDIPPQVPNVQHLIMMSNSMFLLDMEPVQDKDDNTSGTSAANYKYCDVFGTTKEFNSLCNLTPPGSLDEEVSEMFDFKPSNTDPKPINTVHRSASMSMKNLRESFTASSSLLCNPSVALSKLINVEGGDGSISSVGPITINKDVFYSKPVVTLLCQGNKDVQKVKVKMGKAIQSATLRKYGFQAMNWLFHTTTQPMALHDIMWLFCGAMTAIPTPKQPKPTRGNEDISNNQWWCNWLAGLTLSKETRTALHNFLKSISDIIPHLPLTSPLLLQAIQCWGISFSAEDHHFLHDSQIFNNISRILSDNGLEETRANDAYHMETARDGPGLAITNCPEITQLCTIAVPSRQDMIEYLTDGSTETFWESAEERRVGNKCIDITLPPGVSVSTIWFHMDNVRDAAARAMNMYVYYQGCDGLYKEWNQEVTPNFTGWVSFNLYDSSSTNRVVRCEIRGYADTVRVRQIKVCGNLIDRNDFVPLFPTVMKSTIQNETLHLFRNVTYQVFGPVIFNTDEATNRPLSLVDDGLYNGHNDLKEHVVGILFAQENMTILQKQLVVHIVNAIASEAQRQRNNWESNLDYLYPAQGFRDINSKGDEFCFEMLSLVHTLSGCPLGRSSLSKHSFLFKDLLTLLHTGSARVQRQVISIQRRMLNEVGPNKMMNILNATNVNGNQAPKETFVDHLVSYISKSLHVQIKNRHESSATISLPVTMAEATRQSLPDPSAPWYYRGMTSKKHAQMIIRLLKDMAKNEVSPSWTQETTMSIADHILSLTNLSDEERIPIKCITSHVLWRAIGSLCVINDEQANRLNNRGWQSSEGEPGTSKDKSARPTCVNHDDGETLAFIVCTQCGPLCQECDKVLHLNKLYRSHERQVCKEEVTAIQVELHEGCGRVKLFWMLAFVDQKSLKSIIEFQIPVMEKYLVLSSKSTGQCRFCGIHGDSGLLSIGNVCAERECQEHNKNICTRMLQCGHHCGGYKGEAECLPCLYGCAYMTGETPQQDEAASKPLDRPALRQDAEDMCMICFVDTLVAAPTVLLKCGHLYHYHCTKQILEKRWNGPRISFTFSMCPICKDEIDHPAFLHLLEPIRNLQKDVKTKAMIRLEYDSLENATVIATRYNNSAIDYALDRYSYYVCFKCSKAYFGGEAHCDADNLGINSTYDPSELVCGGCSDVTQSKMCKLHGADYLEYKCRYCCTIAIFFCLGDTHFCGGCHDQFQVIRRFSLDELPHCPAGPKGVQLEGTADNCPLHVKHPPTGYEFALGCGICRKNINF